MKLSKLAELKASYQESSAGCWAYVDDDVMVHIPHKHFPHWLRVLPEQSGSADCEDYANAKFIGLSHNITADLLDAVDLLQSSQLYLEKLSDTGDKGAASLWAANAMLLGKLNSNDNAHKNHTVRMYAFVNVSVDATSAIEAAQIAVNNDYSWNISCDKYDVAWSVNDCMMVDVVYDHGNMEDSFDYLRLVQEKGKFQVDLVNTKSRFEVWMYFNIEVEVDDAEGAADAITKAESCAITGDITSNYPVHWRLSDSLESSVDDED